MVLRCSTISHMALLFSASSMRMVSKDLHRSPISSSVAYSSVKSRFCSAIRAVASVNSLIGIANRFL